MDLSIAELALLGVLGVFSGWINVMAGGGSLLVIPTMLFMGIPAPVANGTNRIGILFQNLFAVYGFFRKGFRDFKLSITLAICASIGAVGGALVGVKLDGELFNYLLIIVMVVAMILTMKGNKEVDTDYKPQRLVLGHICMVAVGFWGGLVQIGVGFIIMPVLNRVMHLGLIHTNMHKVFIIFTYTVVALGIFASNIEILWTAGLVLAVGTSIGGYLGAHISVTKGDKWIKVVLYIALSIFAIKLLMQALGIQM